jgi:spore maturation protein CgeB
MTEQMKRLRNEPELCRSLAEKGLETVRARHTCGHRADELLGIVARLTAAEPLRSVA